MGGDRIKMYVNIYMKGMWKSDKCLNDKSEKCGKTPDRNNVINVNIDFVCNYTH